MSAEASLERPALAHEADRAWEYDEPNEGDTDRASAKAVRTV